MVCYTQYIFFLHFVLFLLFRSFCSTQTIYRTFHNVSHCFLLQLEARIEKYGKLPDTIFFQVDGGPENANAASLAMCELLIAKRLTKRIYFTRLMVGHTHEDIDAKF